ncbi:MAG: Mut7-C RNAse domain-containing protein [Verrucomicrobiia bacterium]
MTPTDIRFAADGMLQSLATWLRALGYDCLAGRDRFGRRLLEEAAAEERVFLTRNTHLDNDWPRALVERSRILHVAGEQLPQQLREVVEKFSLDWERFLFTRCLVCNELLRLADKSEALPHLPPRVTAREKYFWRCERCDRFFWHGSHVQNSAARLRQWLGK